MIVIPIRVASISAVAAAYQRGTLQVFFLAPKPPIGLIYQKASQFCFSEASVLSNDSVMTRGTIPPSPLCPSLLRRYVASLGKFTGCICFRRSCPQAASMSSPREVRTCELTPWSRR